MSLILPHFVQQFNYSQKFVHYEIDSALLRHVFCVSLYSVIQSRFELEITNGEANRVSRFFDFAHYSPTFGLIAQPFIQSQILCLIIKILFPVEKYHRMSNRVPCIPCNLPRNQPGCKNHKSPLNAKN